MTTFQQLVWAIGQQESGGNYSAVNQRTGALGKYQVMPGNIASWSRRYLGYTLTPRQFLGSPGLQEKMANAVLGGYYTSYGAADAASAWYSGNPNNANNFTRFRPNEPSIGEYVQQVLTRADGMPGVPQFRQLPQAPDPTPPMPTAPIAAADGGSVLGAVDGVGAGASAADGTALGLSAADGTALPTTPAPTLQGMDSISAAREAAIQMAKSYLGTPYVWGGESKSGVDCSGFTSLALGAAGINAPHYSYTQLSMGQKTDLKSLKPGDLVGWGDGHHVALYLGNNQIIEAAHAGTDVRERTLGQDEGAWGVSLANLYK